MDVLPFLTATEARRQQWFSPRTSVIQSSQIVDDLLDACRIASWADANGNITSPQPKLLLSGTKQQGVTSHRFHGVSPLGEA